MSKAAPARVKEAQRDQTEDFRLRIRKEALLWAVEVDGLSPTTHRVLITLCKEVRTGQPGHGWIAFPSFSGLVKLSGVSKGAVVNSLKELMAKGILTRVGGNIKGDTTVYTFGPGPLPDPRSPRDLGHDVTMVNRCPRTARDHKSIKHSPSTNNPNPKHGSLLKQGSTSAADNSPPETSRSLGQPGERETKVTPAILKSVTASLHAVLRRDAPKTFGRTWALVRVVRLSADHFGVEVPAQLLRELQPYEIELTVSAAAAQSGHLRERQVQIVIAHDGRKGKAPPPVNSRRLWPAEQPDQNAIDRWEQIERELKRNVNDQAFRTWFQPAAALALDGTRLHVGVPNSQYVNWLEEHAEVVRAAVKQAGLAPVAVEFHANYGIAAPG